MGAIALASMGWTFVVAVVGLAGATRGAAPASAAYESEGPSRLAMEQIPLSYLRLYLAAAQRFGIDWAVVAGIGRVECDHGSDPDPSCSREGAVNSAGAGGPMQFLASTWQRFGIDGDGDGRADRWDAADAVYSTANYLRASGAPADYPRAIFAYNHAGWYVSAVLAWAARYRSSGARTNADTPDAAQPAGVTGFLGAGPTPVRLVGGDKALLDPEDGHLALVPAAAPAAVQAMVVAGNELQTLPYGPGGHPDPRGAREEDCSSTVNYVLYRSGIRSIDEILSGNPLAQDYVAWGEPGAGRWVTIYSATQPTDHVFIVIAGLRLDTSHTGTDTGPNRDEDGPRWRVLDHIPTWAHWSVRHPAGL